MQKPNEGVAVVREVWETGLLTKTHRLLGVYGGPPCLVTYPNGDRTIYVMTVFECTVLGGTLRERSDETSALAFVAASELGAYETSGWVRHIIPGLYDRSRAAYFEAPSWQPPLRGA